MVWRMAGGIVIGFPIHGDLTLSADGKRFVLHQGIDEYADRVRIALQLFQGTWWYDQSVGMRFFDAILEKPASTGLALLRSEVRRVIARVPGTLSVLSVSATYEASTRSASVAWVAQSQYGAATGTAEIA